MIRIVIKEARDIKRIKTLLEDNKWLNRSRKIENVNDQYYVYTTLKELPSEFSAFQHDYYNGEDDQKQEKKCTLESIVEDYNKTHNSNLNLPRRWSIYPPMLLFNNPNTLETTNNNIPTDLCQLILQHQLDLFGTNNLTHIAINKPITESNNVMRKPLNILPIYGDFGPNLPNDHYPTSKDFQEAFWCTVTQNGIYQTWSPEYTMFSRGNIKEKKRILDNFQNLKGTVVIDFYCGIGYFSLSYLKNGGKLFCWELNPWSIEGFRRSLEKKGYKYKIIKENEKEFEINNEINNYDAFLFLESNENIPIRLNNVPSNSLNISHINLGLLPTSKPSWSIAKKTVLQKSKINKVNGVSTIIHVHENVHINEFENLKFKIEKEFSSKVIHIEKIKTFAPDIWHVVFDVEM
ncbi:TRM12 [Candida jiufengensis]|uniref:TRM12 n=1 Tax=Candida jiufengensis TaxID=497108 RepID=UPI002224BE35|nr:TRM12 [Candida jiufengensis]KAI5952680.1 TRM12 [Candida jiufengensis]